MTDCIHKGQRTYFLKNKKYRHTAHTRTLKNVTFLHPVSSYGSTVLERDGNSEYSGVREREVVGTAGVAISHTIIEVGRQY